MRSNYWIEFIEDKTSYFEKFLEIIKISVSEQNKKYSESLTKSKGNNSQTDESGYSWEEYLGDLAYEHDITTQLLYKSFIVSIIMFMESKLLELCNHLQKEFRHKFSVYDLTRTGKTRSINYLKIIGVDFLKNKNIKKHFNLAFEIRNNLVHADGKINKKQKDNILNKYKKYLHKKIRFAHNEFIFTENYLKDLIVLNQKICREVSNNWLIKDL